MKENQEEANCIRQFCSLWLVAGLSNTDYFFKKVAPQSLSKCRAQRVVSGARERCLAGPTAQSLLHTPLDRVAGSQRELAGQPSQC